MAIIEDLLIAEPGTHIGLNGKRIRVQRKDNDVVEAPLLHLRSIQILTRGASVSAAALAACCEAGVPVHFVDAFEGNYASVVSSQLTTVVATRRAQLEALADARGVEIARALGAGKIRAQAINLRYLARRQEGASADALTEVETDLLAYADQVSRAQAESVDAIRVQFLGIEGYCARRYWDAVGSLLPDEYGWTGRAGRHADDPINVLLNYGYGILYGEVQKALIVAGLEPYAGLIHTDRPGKPSLTCDLIEEFRAPIVDRTVIGLATRRFAVEFTADGRLATHCRRAFADHIVSRMKAQGIYGRKRYELRSIIQMQARRLAAAFRGDQIYEAYTGG
ncbi:MAG: CRISPR-associated endonuclease Cas1 [Anaerolineae bacterium]|nr:CRISPR-associated endonuclease Cas1 [Anaerolineae bacterium]